MAIHAVGPAGLEGGQSGLCPRPALPLSGCGACSTVTASLSLCLGVRTGRIASPPAAGSIGLDELRLSRTVVVSALWQLCPGHCQVGGGGTEKARSHGTAGRVLGAGEGLGEPEALTLPGAGMHVFHFLLFFKCFHLCI